MSIVLITGDHPRHRYFCQSLLASGRVSGWLCEQREPFEPEPATTLPTSLQQLFRRHFSLRAETENRFFGDAIVDDIPVNQVTAANLCAADSIRFVQSWRPQLVISFGCHKLSDDFMREVGCRFWNVHGGLSPDYRGSATHFWPSYLLEPQMTGVTLHETTSQLDGGAVIHQNSAELVRGDGLHALACRTVAAFSTDLAARLNGLELEELPAGLPQQRSGRIFSSADWRPEHLRLIYEQYDDAIVDAVLDGNVQGREPKLVSVLPCSG